jgi:hypothetical protein
MLVRRFEASDLASLQEQIDEFIDECLDKGLSSWRCTFKRAEVVQTKHGYMEGFLVDGWACHVEVKER